MRGPNEMDISESIQLDLGNFGMVLEWCWNGAGMIPHSKALSRGREPVLAPLPGALYSLGKEGSRIPMPNPLFLEQE